MNRESPQTRFAHERQRMIDSLGKLTSGGVIENMQHIGSTHYCDSLTGSDKTIDIGISTWPYPLDSERDATLANLGYQLIWADSTYHRFTNGSFDLWITEAGGEFWTQLLLVSEYLTEVHDARALFVAAKARIDDSGTQSQKIDALMDATAHDAAAWKIKTNGFSELFRQLVPLKALTCPWYVSSGWAIDLFIGRVTRIHHDLDIAVARQDCLHVQQVMRESGWEWVTPFQNRLDPWPPQMRLELPRHQAHCHREGQMIDFLFSEISEGVWRFRRDPTILRAMERMTLRSESGAPYLAPEVLLLFKSKIGPGGIRKRDYADFIAVRDLMSRDQRAWLRWALAATSPDHPWIDALV